MPKRAQYIRVMLVELQRISSHLVWLGTHAIDLGAMSVLLYCFREREEILKIFEMVRRPAHDDQLSSASADWRWSRRRAGARCVEAFSGHDAAAASTSMKTLLTENRIWHGRTQGRRLPQRRRRDRAGHHRARRFARRAWPTISAKCFPYSSYEEFDFNVPTRTECDCFARYLVRVAEMRESLKIVRQAMDKITDRRARSKPTLPASFRRRAKR